MSRSKFIKCTASLSVLTASAVLAQEVAPPKAVNTLEEIVVTAQRREESAQRAALAIDVITTDELNNAGVVNVSTLNATAPSLAVVKSGGPNTSFFIRGVGNFTQNGYSDPAIAFNIDGVYLGRPTSTVGTFFDLARVEVLKGPQGTLYGRNATGGAINVIPVRPRLGEFGGYVSLGLGNYSARDAEFAVNVPIGDTTALRFSGKVVDTDGYNDDGTQDEKGRGFRAQFLTEVNDNLSVRVAADYSHQGGVGTGASFNGGLSYTPGTVPTATSPANYTYTAANLDPRSGMFSTASKAYFATRVIGGPFINPAPLNYPFQDNDYWGVNSEVTLDTAAGTLTFIPAFRDSKINSLFNGPAFRGGLLSEHDKQTTAELRFAGKRVGPIEYLVGGFYYDEKIHANYTFSQYVVQSYQDLNTTTESNAVFGRLTAHLSDSLRLVGGARYTKDKKTFNGDGTNLIEICTNAPPPFGPGCFGGPSVPVVSALNQLPFTVPTAPGPANSVAFGTFGNRLFYNPVPVHKTAETSRVNYRAAVEFDVTPNSLLYASFETGYRSGGFSVSLGHEIYTPEYIKAYTVGSKNRFMNNRLQLNMEVFKWQYRDQQVSHFGLDSTGGNSFFTENIGRSRIQGVDIDTQFLVVPGTLLRGSVQYLDNKLTSFTYNTARGGTALPPVVGCPFSSTATDALGRPVYAVDCSGKPGYNSPEWSVNLGLEQTFNLSNNNKVVVNLDTRYRGDQVIGFDYLPQQKSGSNWTEDLSVKFGSSNDSWSVAAYVRNLTDKTVPTITQFGGSTGNTISTLYAPPRTFGIRGTVKF